VLRKLGEENKCTQSHSPLLALTPNFPWLMTFNVF